MEVCWHESWHSAFRYARGHRSSRSLIHDVDDGDDDLDDDGHVKLEHAPLAKGLRVVSSDVAVPRMLHRDLFRVPILTIRPLVVGRYQNADRQIEDFTFPGNAVEVEDLLFERMGADLPCTASSERAASNRAA